MPKTVLVLLAVTPMVHAATPADAARKAIALMQSAQKVWFTRHDCASCHHQTLPALAFRDARAHGIAVDETLAHADAAKAFASLADIDRAVQYTHQIDAAMDDGLRLLAAEAAGARPSLTTAVYARHIAVRQMADGHWAAADNRPPQSTSSVTATAIALRAIHRFHHPSLDADTRERVSRARSWLAAQNATCTEERAHQLLGLLWAGAPEAERKRLGAKLLTGQRDDGGWNSINGRPSDAYSTGEALVALHDAAGLPITDSRWRRGVDFLLKAQQPDGSWRIASRLVGPVQVSPPYFDTGYPSGHDQFISIMGAAWAVRALARAAGPAQQAAAPPLTEAAAAAEPWMETLLFGSADDVRRLLDSGWDPKSATRAGTTALMMAMPDVEKVRILIDRGADVNARSKTRYSALLVAAHYPGAGDAIDLLLQRGAEWRLPKGAGAPLFNATAMSLASFAGAPGLVKLAAAHGDRGNENYVAIGMFSIPAVLSPLAKDDVETVRAVLDAGLPVDTAYDDGLTLLDIAVVSDRLNVARLLISRGADVNHVDNFGMTPLHLAASIDYGRSDMIDLLRKSGARLDARGKGGLTPLELARKHGHTNLLKSLGAM